MAAASEATASVLGTGGTGDGAAPRRKVTW